MKKHLNKIPHNWFDLVDWFLAGLVTVVLIDSIVDHDWRVAFAMLVVESVLVHSIFTSHRQKMKNEVDKEVNS